MSITTILIGILLRNPKVKGAIDKGVSDFIEGFQRQPPTHAQKLAALKALVPDMKKPDFAEAFEVREDYFGLLLNTILEAAHLQERPLVLEDFYVPNYVFYFPKPMGEPDVGTPESSSPRTEDGKDRGAHAPKGTPYRFYAVPAGSDPAATLKKLTDGAADDPENNDMNEWCEALASRVGIKPEQVIALDRIGKAKDADRHIFVAPQDVFGKSDLKIQPGPGTRAAIVKALETFLDRPTY